MGRCQHVVQGPERMMLCQRLLLEHIQRRSTQALFLQGLDQRGFIDNRPARGIDQ
ncbi:hypothetical protein D3C73_1510410 [compost metagenome]